MKVVAQSCQLLLAAAGAAAVLLCLGAAIAPADQPPADSPAPSEEQAPALAQPRETQEPAEKGLDQAPAPWLSAGVAEIVKLADAGVSAPIIGAYIENSTIAYQPTADEIIHLHKRGLPAELTIALLRRSGALRAKREAAAGAGTRTAVPPPPAPAAPTVYTCAMQPVVYPVYVPSPPSYSYWYAYSYPAYRYVSWPVYYNAGWQRPWGWRRFWHRPSYPAYFRPVYSYPLRPAVGVGRGGFGHRMLGGFARPWHQGRILGRHR
jgi:hypothetical protein